MDIHQEFFFIRNLLLMLVLVVGLFIMQSLAGIMLPLVMALLLSILYLPIVLYLEAKRIPMGLIVTFIAVFTLAVILVVANIFISTINEIIGQQDFLINQLETKFLAIAGILTSLPYLNLDLLTIQEGLNNLLDRNMITTAASGILRGASSFGSSFLMFTLYFLFLLPGMSHYQSFLRYVGGENESLLRDYETIQKNVSTYMIIKTILSLVTGTITWVICTILGLKFAFFWGFLTFILNFIPSIGSIIATILPSLMGLILFDSYNKVLLLLILLGVNQMIIGNFLDPRIMGNRLRLNTVTVLFGLVFWGVIWGIPGMLLSVPLSVSMKLMLEKSRSWSMIARIMGYPEKPAKPSRNKRPFFRKKE
ncbi:AI-2E family transporter [Oceanispirochaeta sp.]|jgi:AI-2 transport protein TqsA|uniref:AI-2E family transporter n=1 Tax=Oceanispirochaeta sp. TaxID=2035350 RepID=UPI002619748B|nr:AI-2E family transporter [Oceanispirochaeta sp.]MDA3956368.1 AI-2E family transporter [Oceanispirochaeta sp.]